MKLYLLSQTVNFGYDTHDACVVAAESDEEARKIHPTGRSERWGCDFDTWAHSPEFVRVEYIGEAAEGTTSGVILASFNAG